MKRLTITGNIGRDAELRFDSAGAQFATFSVAVSAGTKANPKTEWVDISCNGRLADVAIMYAKKGVRVLVDGYPNVVGYLNKDSVATASLRLHAHIIEFLSKIDTENRAVETHELTHGETTEAAAF